MPRQTRNQRAGELVKALELGPAFQRQVFDAYTPSDAAAQYRKWVKAWVLPTIEDLIPELKKRDTK